MAKARETTSDSYDSGLREQPSTLAQRDLISTVLDMKVDVRLEMQRMSQRITRIEELLTELVNRLVIDSSEQSSPGDNLFQQQQQPSPSSPTAVSPSTTGTTLVPSTSEQQLSGPSGVLSGSGGGNGLGPILLRKRRTRTRKPPAPAPPPSFVQYTESEQTRLIEQSETSDLPSTSSTRKREFL
jgi:potassium voltage-gated channel Eag-related subfamily H member 5